MNRIWREYAHEATVLVSDLQDPVPAQATAELRELVPESPNARHPADWPRREHSRALLAFACGD